MRIDEIVTETKLVWARRGNKVKRRVRCIAGPRRGRIVSDPAQCYKPPDVKKRISLQRTKLGKGLRMTRKARRTKRYNPVSKRVSALNKSSRR